MSLIPEGTYPAKATGEYEFGVTDGGNEQVGVAYRITSGDHAGRVLTWYGYFSTQENAQRAIKSLRASGWKGDNLADLVGLGESEVNIVVEIDEYDPQKPRNKIAWVNGAGVAMKNVMTEQQKKALAARMKGLVVATGGGQKPANGQRSQQRQAPPPRRDDGFGDGGYEDDPIPF